MVAAARTGVLILALCLGGSASAVSPLGQTPWSALSAVQREVLAPLKGDWDTMSEAGRQTWLGIASEYPALMPEEQARIRARMQDWARLSPEERERARDQYRALRSMPPEQREQLGEQWQQYRQKTPAPR